MIPYSHMEGFHTIYKKRGETLKVLLLRFREESGISEDIPITYAGRLDPLAEGLMILLSGDMVHEKEKYMGLSKTYTVSVLVGFETDTYDILGIPGVYTDGTPDIQNYCEEKKVPDIFIQKYPPYSSKTVNGKPLFMYAREGASVEQPVHSVTLEAITYGNKNTLQGKELLENIEKLVDSVDGDFRQEEILKNWSTRIDEDGAFTLHTFTVSVSSGFYIRTFVHDMGEVLGTPLCVYSLKRESVGEYKVFE